LKKAFGYRLLVEEDLQRSEDQDETLKGN